MVKIKGNLVMLWYWWLTFFLPHTSIFRTVYWSSHPCLRTISTEEVCGIIMHFQLLRGCCNFFDYWFSSTRMVIQLSWVQVDQACRGWWFMTSPCSMLDGILTCFLFLKISIAENAFWMVRKKKGEEIAFSKAFRWLHISYNVSKSTTILVLPDWGASNNRLDCE